MKQIKDKKILLVLVVAILLVLVVGATFAFFTAQSASSQEINANVTTTTGDSNSFMVSGNLTLNATLDNFSETNGDLSSTVTGKVIFQAGNQNQAGSDLCYTVSVEMTNNNFNYTNSSSYPELVLEAKYKDQTSYVTTPNITISDVGLHEYTNNIGTINYVTVPVVQANQETGYPGRASAISGYDVTTNTQTFNIPYQASNNQFKIHANAGETIEQDWIFKLNFINYEWDQADVTNANNNNNKTFNGKVVFTKVTCAEPIVYKYWNNNFIFEYNEENIANSNGFYNSTSMPNDETKTAPEGRTYDSRELLASAYDAAYTGEWRNDKYFENRPFYIRTAIQGENVIGHEACIYDYNTHKEFCLKPPYWAGTIGVNDATAGANTAAKLKADIESALGVTIDDCSSYGGRAYCYIGSFECDVSSYGDVSCYNYDDESSCVVREDGSANCYY